MFVEILKGNVFRHLQHWRDASPQISFLEIRPLSVLTEIFQIRSGCAISTFQDVRFSSMHCWEKKMFRKKILDKIYQILFVFWWWSCCIFHWHEMCGNKRNWYYSQAGCCNKSSKHFSLAMQARCRFFAKIVFANCCCRGSFCQIIILVQDTEMWEMFLCSYNVAVNVILKLRPFTSEIAKGGKLDIITNMQWDAISHIILCVKKNMTKTQYFLSSIGTVLYIINI